MKKIVALLLVMAAFVALPMSVNAKGAQAKIKFNEYKYDFGNVKENGGDITHDFVFTNTGDGNLIIIDATATCGCTKPKYPENPIPPGKTGVIKVTYNPKHRPGPIDRTITVRTNGSPKKVTLRIVGNVTPANK